MPQGLAGEFIATEAEPDSLLLELIAILDRAGDAGMRLESIIRHPATRTGPLVAYVGSAKAAVHSARGDQRFTSRV